MSNLSFSSIKEFTVPLGMETCQQRLLKWDEHNKLSLKARTWVQMHQIDANTYRFSLKIIKHRVPSVGIVRGYLRRTDAQQTAVIVEQQIIWFWIVLPLVLMFLWLAGLAFWVKSNPQDMMQTQLITSIAVILGMVFVIWGLALHQLNKLRSIVAEALGRFY